VDAQSRRKARSNLIREKDPQFAGQENAQAKAASQRDGAKPEEIWLSRTQTGH
jgi:hypothetical protein